MPFIVNMSAEWARMLTNNQSKDAQLLQNKQLSLEAQNILSIIETCISKIEIAAALPSVLQFNNMSGVSDKHLSKALQDHQILVEKLEKLESLEQESDGEQVRDAWEAKERTQLENNIKNSLRGLLRLFRAHSDVISGLMAELDIKVEESEYELLTGLKMFHNHMQEELMISPNKELQLSLNKEESSSSGQKAMKQADAKLSLNKEESSSSAQKAMKQIDAEISLQGCSGQEDTMSPFKDKQVQALIEESKIKQDLIQQEINQLQIQLTNLMLENRQAERLLQEKNVNLEMKIDDLIQNFDDNIEEIQTNLEVNKHAVEMEDEELKKLEKIFAALEKEYNQILESRQLAKKREEMRELELKTKAAILAQAWWRGYSVRKTLNKGKTKKAKKGKRKGKGKKTK